MTPDDAPSPQRFLIAAILFLTYAAFGLSWIALTPLAGEVMAELKVSTTQFAMLSTMVSVAKVVAPLATGFLAVRIGLKNTILIGSALISCAMLAPFAPNFELFLASRFVFGLGGAIVVTLLGPMTMQWFPASERPIVTAFNNVAVNTGISITLLTTVPLATAVGWRKALMAYAGLSVLLFLAWALFGKEKTVPVAVAAPSAQEDQAVGAESPQAAAAAPVVGYLDVWRMPETWWIALSFAGPLALYLAFNTFLPKHFMEAYGMTKAAASGYTAIFNLVGIPTAIVAGLLTKQLGLRRPFIIGAGLLMGFAGLGLTLFAQPLLITISAVALGVAMFTYVAPLFTIPMEMKGNTPAHVSLMMGTVFSFAYLVSSLSPMLVGFLHDGLSMHALLPAALWPASMPDHSFAPGFLLWTLFSWVLALGGFMLPETGPKAKPVA